MLKPMSFYKKTIREFDIRGKRVLVRVDYNVPMDKQGNITGDYRIQASLPTIRYLLDQECKIVLISHLGRPEGKPDPAFSLEPAAKRLSELLKQEVIFVKDCVGDEPLKVVNQIAPREIVLLENLRFHPEEEANDQGFAEQLARYGDVFVQDGFGVVHRAHASTDAVARIMKPALAGLLLEKEVDTITRVMENPERPLMAIIGGAKIADKIEILNKFIETADFVAIGGAMANTFLRAEGIATGKSLAEPDSVPVAKEILQKARDKAKNQQFVFYVPQDGVVAKDMENPQSTRIVDWETHVVSDIENYPKLPPKDTGQVADDELILDIGPFSASFMAGGAQMVKTVVWNGTMGVTETKSANGPVGPFARGTELIIESLVGHFGHRPFTVVGGGDTASYIEDRGLTNAFNHVSTGGGACLELMSGKELPGVQVLWNKD